MTLNFTCENKQQISRLFCFLLGQEINSLNLQLNLSDISKNEVNTLLYELKALEIPFIKHNENESEEDELDDNDDVEESNENDQLGLRSRDMKFSVKHTWYNNEEKVHREISDDVVLFHIKRLFGETQLLKIAKKYEIDIELSKIIELDGPDERVNEAINEILSISSQVIGPMSYSEALCLKNTFYFHSLQKEYNTKLIIVYDAKQQGFNLIIYGEDPNKVLECKEKMVKVSKHIKILLEITKEDDLIDVSTQILDFFKDRYKIKCQELFLNKVQHYQIDIVQNKKSSKRIFYFFSNCEDSQFQSISEYLSQDTKDLCLLNITPGTNSTVSLNVPTNPLRSKIHFSQLEKGSYLLIGKLKHFMTEIPELLQEKSFGTPQNSFKLSIRKFIDLERDTLKELSKLSEVEQGHNFDSFLVNSSSSNVYQILKRFELFLMKEKKENNDQIIIQSPSKDDSQNGYYYGLMEERKSTEISAERVHKDEGSFRDQDDYERRVFTKSSLNKEESFPNRSIQKDLHSFNTIFPEENLNKDFYMYDGNPNQEVEPLDPRDPAHSRIERILRRGYFGVKLVQIVKSSFLDLWKKYVKFRSAYKANQVKEYILMVASEDDPLELIDNNLEVNELFKTLVGTIDIKKNKLFKDEDGNYNVLVCVVLFDDNDSIISYYPAYFLIFK